MNKTIFGFYASLLVFLVVLFLLLTGSTILNIPLDSANTIPLGTFITNIGMIALPLTLLFGVKQFRAPSNTTYKILSNVLKTALVLVFLWIPISYFLAGNISFSFAEKETFQGGQLAMQWFWRLSYGVVLVPLIVLLIHWILLLVKRLLV